MTVRCRDLRHRVHAVDDGPEHARFDEVHEKLEAFARVLADGVLHPLARLNEVSIACPISRRPLFSGRYVPCSESASLQSANVVTPTVSKMSSYFSPLRADGTRAVVHHVVRAERAHELDVRRAANARHLRAEVPRDLTAQLPTPPDAPTTRTRCPGLHARRSRG